MNKVYQSCRMELLCDKLAEDLKAATVHIFSKTMIITQGGGMNAWLTAQIAEKNGIFAHFEFQDIDGFLGTVFELLTGEKLTSNRDAIRFGIYSLLNSDDFKLQFPAVSDYYQGSELRRMQLSEKIADIFGQYQLYRETMISSWEAGQAVAPQLESEEWQRWLWCKLGIPSKAGLRDRIFEELKRDPAKLKENWPEIHLFGISVMTNFHREFYARLGKFIDVNYYICLPSLVNIFNNSLMESLGTKAAELAVQFPVEMAVYSEFPEPGSGTLLHCLQTSIIQNNNIQVRQTDESIQVSSFYSVVREVEGLYNFLLDLFETDRKLKPKDILVLAPDINTYEPYIRAVFRNAPVDLPVQISGAATTTGDSITASLELLSNITEEDLTSERVMGLLEQNRIRLAYQVEDTALLRAMINKAGIRFGLENRLEDDSHFVSWACGLERFILGYAMLSDEPFDVSFRLDDDGEETGERLTSYPFKDAEASASHDLLRLKAFVDDLQVLFSEQKTPRTLSAWKLFFFEKVFGEMVWSNDFDKNDRQERTEIYRALGFTDRLSASAAEEEIPWDVFLYELKKRLFTESRSHELNIGAITFTSALPSRGLPFEVIVFIGLDNGIFPGQDSTTGFDLMGNDYKPSDPSRKEAGKSLFADVLMAARRKLYLSYIGQSIKDNSALPPSIVLDNLMDYLGLNAVKHPLHGFSKRYDNAELFTYLYSSAPRPGLNAKKESDSLNNETPQEIWVNDFRKFFEAPFEWYFKKVLGIYYDSDDDTLPETELFELDNLKKWKINSCFLKDDGDPEDFIRRQIQLGDLPLKNLGQFTVEKILKESAPIRHKFRELTNGQQEQSVAIDLTIGNFRIKGFLEGVYGGQLVMYGFSKDEVKYKQRAFLYALLLAASGYQIRTILLSPKDIIYEPLAQDEALSKLNDLVAWIEKGERKPLKFNIKSIKHLLNEKTDKSPEAFLKLFRDEAYPDYKDGIVNLYLQHLFEENYFDDFSETDIEIIRELSSLLDH